MTHLLKELALTLRAAIRDWHRTFRLIAIILAVTVLVAAVTGLGGLK